MSGRPVRIKLCGLRTLEDARAAHAAGADLLGFVLAESQRQLAPGTVAGIVMALAAESAAAGGPAPLTVGVLGEGDLSVLAAQARAARVTAVQVALNATPDRCMQLGAELGLPVIGVYHVHDGELSSAELELLLDACDLVILDAPSMQGGGSGQRFDHAALGVAGRSARLGVAGGLTPGDVGELVRRYAPALVDVSSGIETSGRKDPALMRAFVAAVRAACEAPLQEGTPHHG